MYGTAPGVGGKSSVNSLQVSDCGAGVVTWRPVYSAVQHHGRGTSEEHPIWLMMMRRRASLKRYCSIGTRLACRCAVCCLARPGASCLHLWDCKIRRCGLFGLRRTHTNVYRYVGLESSNCFFLGSSKKSEIAHQVQLILCTHIARNQVFQGTLHACGKLYSMDTTTCAQPGGAESS